jgi:hypothetical protein
VDLNGSGDVSKARELVELFEFCEHKNRRFSPVSRQAFERSYNATIVILIVPPCQAALLVTVAQNQAKVVNR